MNLIQMPIGEIIPYKNNPRKNDSAVEAVAESIRQCGYVAPIIVDDNNVVLAGHTRLKALIKLGYETANVLRVYDLTEEQKRKYRLLDNKTGELAEWDLDLLADELEGLDFGDLDLDWGLGTDEDEGDQGEKPGNFSKSEFEYTQQYGVTVILGNEAEQEACYNKLRGMGYECRVVTV